MSERPIDKAKLERLVAGTLSQEETGALLRDLDDNDAEWIAHFTEAHDRVEVDGLDGGGG